ncbi:MAG: nitrite reductase small subunit NirD [Myxococcales bacterium]|nr:MAG: nitrite reductase small subunit NirD [Myxococcales bacterium]
MSSERLLADRRILLCGPSDLDSVARHLRDLGADVQRTELSAQSSTRSLEAWISELMEGAFDDVLFLTGQGVRVLVEFAHQRGREDEVLGALSHVRIIASGSKTRAALAEIGLRPVIFGDETSTPSLIDALGAASFSGRTLAVAALSCDARLIAAATARGASVRLLAGEDAPDGRPRALLAGILGRDFDAVAFGSSREIDCLFEAAAPSQRAELAHALRRCNPVALGQAVARALSERGVPPSGVVERASLLRPRGIDFMTVFRAGTVKSGEGMSVGKSAKTRRKSLVVIGNGMVSYKLCELLSEYDHGESYDISVFCEEPRPAYDRVKLTSFFEKESADELLLADANWYKERKIRLLLGERAVRIDRGRRAVLSSSGEWVRFDNVVIATGSAPFVPPIPGVQKPGVFVYRTIEDLEAIREHAKTAKVGAVLGGGLLGLEAAKAVLDLGLPTHVIEFAPRLMPRQLDAAGGRLLAKAVETLGVKVHTSRAATSILGQERAEGLAFKDGETLECDLIVVSAGIRPRDELAREAGLALGERGGILVDDKLRTSDQDIFAIGECALHQNTLYGLVAPGYQMAEVCARVLTGADASFQSVDQSAKLKLLGTDVASFGDPFAESNGERTIAYEDLVKGVYKKLVVSADRTKLVGGVLVGDAGEYAALTQLMRSGESLPAAPEELLFGAREGKTKLTLSDSAQICSCNNVTKGTVCKAVRSGICNLADLKKATKAGTGCGGCMALVTDVLNAELAAAGKAVKKELCEHFAFSRQELYQIVRVKKQRTFKELLTTHGQGHGCEVCKPVVASILASVHNDMILQHDTLQDSNDRYLANLQRSGLYSVVPRIPAGEITPEKLITLGEIAKKWGLYTKITGGQRIDMFGARVEQLPEIWDELVAAGFESGHAYGKAVRTVKSCVGSTWCRFGVQDSVSFAIRVEERYKGIRAPHKLKSAVSGCTRECAEAQSKDFGLIATEKGWNLYVCGNGGIKPRHADLLASDLSEDEAIKLVDRFLMFYIRTADRLTRTSTWLDKMDGGIQHLREVIIDDKLGICAELEQDLQYLVSTFKCEWAETIKDPARRAKFRHFANTGEADDTIELVDERGQRRPRDWEKLPAPPAIRDRRHLPLITTQWVKVASIDDVPPEGGIAIKYGQAQIALYNFASRGEWYACQNQCPHMSDMVLARGLIGDEKGVPKVACPQHKKTFSLKTGECLSGDQLKVRTFPVKVEGGAVFLELPSEAEIEKLMPIKARCDLHEEAASAAE